jgi:hypothetical protein
LQCVCPYRSFQPRLFDDIIATKEPFIAITIEGLKNSYSVGEPIDFTFRVEN